MNAVSEGFSRLPGAACRVLFADIDSFLTVVRILLARDVASVPMGLFVAGLVLLLYKNWNQFAPEKSWPRRVLARWFWINLAVSYWVQVFNSAMSGLSAVSQTPDPKWSKAVHIAFNNWILLSLDKEFGEITVSCVVPLVFLTVFSLTFFIYAVCNKVENTRHI